MSADYKLVPYGISDFEQLRKENKYLVDKTMFFEKMERAGNFLFWFVRAVSARASSWTCWSRITTSTKRTTFKSFSRDCMWLTIRQKSRESFW